MNKLNPTNYVRPSTKLANPASLSNDILLILLYFDIFSYPLTAKEILNHSTITPLSESLISKELEVLIEKKFIQLDGGFYCLSTRKGLAEKRIKGNKKAAEYILKARKISSFIASFPFIRGVFLSGSVSKGYADQHADIDYFIVTEPGRLWLARTLLIFFKKTFLLNSRKYFCLNYFIDKDHLEIQDKNLFTAIELAYLLPVYNEETRQAIVHRNDWIHSYLPNFTPNSPSVIKEKKRFLKNGLEKLLSGFFGNKLDDFCLFITENFWKYKFRKKIALTGSAIRCQKHISKFHPQNFQHKILETYEQKISEYSKMHSIQLHL